MHTHIHTHQHINIYTERHTHKHTHKYTRTQTHTNTHTQTHTRAHTHLHTHTHTHKYTHTHTHTLTHNIAQMYTNEGVQTYLQRFVPNGHIPTPVLNTYRVLLVVHNEQLPTCTETKRRAPVNKHPTLLRSRRNLWKLPAEKERDQRARVRARIST